MSPEKAKAMIKGVEGNIDELLNMLGEDLLAHGYILKEVNVGVLQHRTYGIGGIGDNVDVIKCSSVIKVGI